MKRFALVGILVALMAVAIVGCSWETGNDATSWSNVYNWVNFSGTYYPMTTNGMVVDNVGVSSLTVVHQGQNVTIIDNRGTSYSGYISGIQSISGVYPTIQNTNSMVMPKDNDQIVASYSCSGFSGNYGNVRIVGTLEGQVQLGVFNARRIYGTWIGTGSADGAVAGAAAAVELVIPTNNSSTNTIVVVDGN